MTKTSSLVGAASLEISLRPPLSTRPAPSETAQGGNSAAAAYSPGR